MWVTFPPVASPAAPPLSNGGLDVFSGGKTIGVIVQANSEEERALGRRGERHPGYVRRNATHSRRRHGGWCDGL